MKVMSMALSVVLVACVAVGSAVAGHMGDGREKAWGGGFHGRMGFMRLIDKLSLNADQEKEIASILAKHREEIEKVVNGIVEARSNLREAVMADETSEGTVKQAAQRLSEHQEQAALLAVQVLNEVRPVLTTVQKDTMKALIAKHASRVHGFVDARLERLDDWIAEHNR